LSVSVLSGEQIPAVGKSLYLQGITTQETHTQGKQTLKTLIVSHLLQISHLWHFICEIGLLERL